MEKVQKRALRFEYNDFTLPYKELFAKGNYSTLYITRLRYMATEFYKCMNSLNPTYLQDMVTTIKTEHTLRNPKPVQQSKSKTVTHGINYFRYKGSKIWNSVPTDIQNYEF